MSFVTLDNTTVRDIVHNGHRTVLSSYYGKTGDKHDGPQAYLSNHPEKDAMVDPHFHDVDQFQLIVLGDGYFGKERVVPGFFHYASAFTPYGPIVGTDNGIGFLTLRGACSGGFFAMPEKRHLLAGKRGRNLSGAFKLGQPLPDRGASTREVLLEQEDGVKVIGLRLGPHAQVSSEPTDGGIQYYAVCTGSLVSQGREFPQLSLTLVEPGQPAQMFQAHEHGAELLMLQLPRPS